MELPININTDTTPGNLRIIDQGGYLYAVICANSTKGMKTLGVKTADALDENLESYIETAKGFEQDLYDSCFDGPLSIEVTSLEEQMAKYCDTQTKLDVKTQIREGREEETKKLLAGF